MLWLLGRAAVLLGGYGLIARTIGQRAESLRAHPPQQPADAALVLGNRAYRNGAPDPCLTGRVEAAGAKRVIVVSELYHLWRVERLARASGFDGHFDVQYAAAPTSCWRRWGMRFRGALREPLAIVNNAAHGQF